jgi:CO/xanthine dehydrogenase Mo-binding subunit
MGDPGNHDMNIPAVLTGKMDYGSDRMAGNKWYGALKLANIGHGKITKIDASKALEEPGVKAVVTYEDVPTWNQNILYWGQEVAGVVAEDWYTAIRAATLIEVTYDVLPGIYDAEAGFEPGAVLSGVYPTTNLNPATPGTFVRGDVNGTTGFSAADVVLQTNEPWTTTYAHQVLEPRQCVAWWVSDHVYAWSASQNPFPFHSTLPNGMTSYFQNLGKLTSAETFPANHVHYFTHGTGGGHGDRLSTSELVPAAVMSHKVNGYPVNLIYTRKETSLTRIRQFDATADIKIGAKHDGTLVAIDAQRRAHGSGATGLYYGINKTFKCPNLNYTYQSVYLNAPTRGAWRCVADPPGAVLYDMALDKLATELNMDPYQLRMKNIMDPEDRDQDSPNRVWSGKSVNQCFDTVYAASGYAQKWHTPGTKTLEDGRMHGIAITGHQDSHGSISGTSRGALVTMAADGTAWSISAAPAVLPTRWLCASSSPKHRHEIQDVTLGEWGNTTSASAPAARAARLLPPPPARLSSRQPWTCAPSCLPTPNHRPLQECGATVNDLDAKNSVVS